jgi:hypothetical protein
MALKTIPVFFNTSTAGVASAATRTFSTVTAHIAEMAVGTTTIRHAYLQMYFAPNANVAATNVAITLKANGDATGSSTNGDPGINAGAQSIWFDGEFGSYLNTQWPTAGDCTLDLEVVVTGPQTNNVCAILWITFEFTPGDCATRTHWVPLCLGDYNGKLNGTLATIATIPRLDGNGGTAFGLLEDSLTVRQTAVVFEGGQGNPVPFGGLEVSVGGATTTFGTETHQSRNYARWARYITSGNSTLTTTHTVQARVTTAGGTPNHFSNLQTIVHYVYTYAATTAAVTVAGCRFVSDGMGQLGATTEDNSRAFEWEHHVPETPTFQGPMACQMILADSVLLPVEVRGAKTYASNGGSTGSQSAIRLYDLIRWPDGGEPYSFAHRLDPGGTVAGGVSLTKGFNRLRLSAWVNATTYGDTNQYGTEPCVVWWYAYNAAAPAAGPHVCSRTIISSLRTWRYTTAGTNRNRRFTGTPIAQLPSADVYYNAVGHWWWNCQIGPAISVFRMMQRLSTEGLEQRQSWIPMGDTGAYGSYDMDYCIAPVDSSRHFRRWSAQPRTLHHDGLIVNAARLYNFQCGQRAMAGLQLYVDYHEQVITKTVNVTGYAGDGSGIEVNVFRLDTDEHIARLTSAVGGSASFTWPDDTVALYAVAREDSTHLGRSDNTTSATITVAFPTAAAPGAPGSRFNRGLN